MYSFFILDNKKYTTVKYVYKYKTLKSKLTYHNRKYICLLNVFIHSITQVCYDFRTPTGTTKKISSNLNNKKEKSFYTSTTSKPFQHRQKIRFFFLRLASYKIWM